MKSNIPFGFRMEKMINEFKKYHPVVNFIYFTAVIGFSMFLMHPVCLALSFVNALVYMRMLKGRKAFLKNIVYIIPSMLVAALINPLFNHNGVTVIANLPGGALTLEAVLYGLAAACMLINVISWFLCFNEIITNDKLIYLSGRLFPSMSLVLCMTLRFVPEFAIQLRKISDAQKCIGKNIHNGSIVSRAKNGLSVLSVMISRAFEKSVETADSMRSRGYGLSERTSFTLLRITSRDVWAIGFVAVCTVYTFIGVVCGKISFVYYPAVAGTVISGYSVSVFAAYLFLLSMPILIELREIVKWNVIK